MNGNDLDILEWITNFGRSGVWSIPLTLLAYSVALWLYRRGGQSPLLNPVLFGMGLTILVIKGFEIDYERYYDGAQVIHFLLGTATVGLAIPLYRQLKHLKASLVPILVSSFLGALIASLSALVIATLLGASELTLLSLAPKSTTTPVAMAIAEHMGGLAPLAAVIVIVTGIIGAVFGLGFLRFFGFKDVQVLGIAMGVAAHGVGTARAMQVDYAMGAYAGLSMGLVAVINSLLVPQIWALLSPMLISAAL